MQTALPSAAVFNILSDSEDTDTADEEIEDSEVLSFADKVNNFCKSLPKYTTVSEKQMAFETMFNLSESDSLKFKLKREPSVLRTNSRTNGNCEYHKMLLRNIYGKRFTLSSYWFWWNKMGTHKNSFKTFFIT